MTEQLNAPVPITVAPQLPMVAPAAIVVLTMTPGEKPVPDMVTEVPVGPWLGRRLIDGVVTVKTAVARSKLPSDPVAVTA